jgi:hypothetical protein
LVLVWLRNTIGALDLLGCLRARGGRADSRSSCEQALLAREE